MESLGDFTIAYRSHEPEGKERGCVEDQPQHSRTANVLRLVEDDTAALRFMGRLHVLFNVHRNPEPTSGPSEEGSFV
jgi:hypothetical protein